MAVEFFQHDEEGYAAWLAEHARGHVVNVDETGTTGTRIHKASCPTLRVGAGGGKKLTSSYPKACSRDRGELDAWHRERYGCGLRELRCKICEPSNLQLS